MDTDGDGTPPWGKAASLPGQLHSGAVAAALGAAEPPLFPKPDSAPNLGILHTSPFPAPALLALRIPF